MKHRLKFSALLLLMTAVFLAQAAPQYANEQTKTVIEKMLKAHGGYDKWRAIPAMRFDSIMHNNYHGPNELAWWAATEYFDMKTLQVYQDWFLNDAVIAYDGKDVWSKNWNKANPPTSVLYFFYYFVNLPWLTQDDNVVLSEVSEFAWPGQSGKTYFEVKMTFTEKPKIGKSALDYFVLYIDPDSYRMAGYQYAVGNRALLDSLGQPADRQLFGPLWRLITRYQTVDGLVFPAAFRTMPEANERIVGNHLILDIELSAEFDPAMFIMPEGAVIDDPANR